MWHLMARLAGWQQPGTIQGAIDLASDGDTIIIGDGIYTGTGNRDIDFDGKSVTIRSENGPRQQSLTARAKVTASILLAIVRGLPGLKASPYATRAWEPSAATAASW